MKFLSCFAGIGGFDLGLEHCGMRCIGQVEIDQQCRKVLDYHWPDVRKASDIRKVKGRKGSADLVCGGFPCQDLSVAGRRAGLAGERSGLFFEFARIIAEIRPRWILVENVPGLLSSNDGRDMGAIVGTLGQLGYGWAYRVLDAQYFGLAQRRERLFLVGHLGDSVRPCKVLFEPESLQRHPPKGQKKEQEIAATLRGRSHSHGINMPGRGGEDDLNLMVVESIRSNYAADHVGDESKLAVVRCDASGHGKRYDLDSEDFVVGFNWQSGGNKNFVGGKNGKTSSLSVGQTPAVASRSFVRRLTPLECCRLQGFPDDWLDLDPLLSDSAKYRMLGNAVPPPVVEWIGKRMATIG